MNQTNMAQAMLARHMYLHWCKYKKAEPRAGMYAPEWAYDYAHIAMSYLPPDADGINAMVEDLGHTEISSQI